MANKFPGKQMIRGTIESMKKNLSLDGEHFVESQRHMNGEDLDRNFDEEMANNSPRKQMIRKTIENMKKNLSLDSDQPEHFTKSRCLSSKLYLAYRWVMFLHWFIFLDLFFFLTPDKMYYGLKWRHKGFFFIYFTTWATIIIVLDTGLQAAIVTKLYWKSGENNYMDRLKKYSWILETINTDVALTITVTYWGFLHEYKHSTPGLATIEAHLMNSVYVVINIVISARPVKFFHVLYPLVFGFVYVVFTACYHWGNGTNPHDWQEYIYPILDWNHPGNCIGNIMLGSIGIILTHGLTYAVHCIREYCQKKRSIDGHAAVGIDEHYKDSTEESQPLNNDSEPETVYYINSDGCSKTRPEDCTVTPRSVQPLSSGARNLDLNQNAVYQAEEKVCGNYNDSFISSS